MISCEFAVNSLREGRHTKLVIPGLTRNPVRNDAPQARKLDAAHGGTTWIPGQARNDGRGEIRIYKKLNKIKYL
jgi:hypothetical protein